MCSGLLPIEREQCWGSARDQRARQPSLGPTERDVVRHPAVFDPITMQPHHAAGDDVPCWMLDTAYNGMVFHADQVFFPKTAAWDSLRRALRATHDDAVWAHLAGDTSAPFAAAVGGDIAVKVIDERGMSCR